MQIGAWACPCRPIDLAKLVVVMWASPFDPPTLPSSILWVFCLVHHLLDPNRLDQHLVHPLQLKLRAWGIGSGYKKL